MTFQSLIAGYPVWFWALLSLPLLLNFFAIAHAYYRHFPTIQEKMVWLCVVVFVPVLGGVVYFIVGRKRGIKSV